MPARFAGKRVLVTGASRGMGRFVAVAFAREGAHVGIGYRSNEREALQTQTMVEKDGGTASLHPFDVRDHEAVESAVDTFAASVGVDVLINSAASVRDGWAAQLPVSEWKEVVDVNLGGTFLCSRAVARRMMPRRSGAIVNVSSVAALRASPGQASYAASKGGVLSLTATMAAEFAPRGIRVNAVVPGILTTGMGRRLDHRVAAQRRELVPLGRFGEGDEVARAVMFLASDDASYIVGQSLIVDGGLSL